jgi:hypothetical protein
VGPPQVGVGNRDQPAHQSKNPLMASAGRSRAGSGLGTVSSHSS